MKSGIVTQFPVFPALSTKVIEHPLYTADVPERVKVNVSVPLITVQYVEVIFWQFPHPAKRTVIPLSPSTPVVILFSRTSTVQGKLREVTGELIDPGFERTGAWISL